MKVQQSLNLGAYRLLSHEEGVTLSANGQTTELPGVSLAQADDRITLESDEQTLTFQSDGKRAWVTDKADPQSPTYELAADGTFHFELAGYPVTATPSAEGTLVTPAREVNPILPLRSFLPAVELDTTPTPRTSTGVRLFSALTSSPFKVGLAVGIGVWVARDFAVGLACGALASATCLGLRPLSKRMAYKSQTHRLGTVGPLREGEVDTAVMRGKSPSAGRSRSSLFRFRGAEFKLHNGVALEDRGRYLLVRNQQEELALPKAEVLLEGRTLKVKEPKGRLQSFAPNGNLVVESEGTDAAGEFAPAYEVLKSQGDSDPNGELEFEENEVIIDDFSIPYDH